jgi:hypothetical protein
VISAPPSSMWPPPPQPPPGRPLPYYRSQPPSGLTSYLNPSPQLLGHGSRTFGCTGFPPPCTTRAQPSWEPPREQWPLRRLWAPLRAPSVREPPRQWGTGCVYQAKCVIVGPAVTCRWHVRLDVSWIGSVANSAEMTVLRTDPKPLLS